MYEHVGGVGGYAQTMSSIVTMLCHELMNRSL
jgi:hypothetical protein